VGHHLRLVWLTLLLRYSHHEQACLRGCVRKGRFQSGLDGDTHCASDVGLGIDFLAMAVHLQWLWADSQPDALKPNTMSFYLLGHQHCGLALWQPSVGTEL